MTDHGGCVSAYEREKRRAEFAEARIAALTADIYALGSKMDGVGGNKPQSELNDMTLGGAVRFLVNHDLNRRT